MFLDSDERIDLDMHNVEGYSNEFKKLKRDDGDLVLNLELKNAVTNKFRFRVWRYSQGEYLYLLGNRGVTMKYKEYTIIKEKNLES